MEPKPNPYHTLAGIDVGEHIERKGNLTYLSWSWAVTKLLEAYPNATWSFAKSLQGNELFTYEDGTGEVRCTVKVEEIERTCSLPVMDHRNNAVQNPNARQVNDTKQRCLAKAIALHGLGLYIYAGEDVPQATPVPDPWDQFVAKLNGRTEMIVEFLRDKGSLADDAGLDALDQGMRQKAMERPNDLIRSAVAHWEAKQEVPV